MTWGYCQTSKHPELVQLPKFGAFVFCVGKKYISHLIKATVLHKSSMRMPVILGSFTDVPSPQGCENDAEFDKSVDRIY
jgi:hypothetical protein